MSAETERLKKALHGAQREIKFLREDLERTREENLTLLVDIDRLQSSSHRTSSDQISIQQWQDRAEEAEREIFKMRNVNFPRLMRGIRKTFAEEMGIHINPESVPEDPLRPRLVAKDQKRGKDTTAVEKSLNANKIAKPLRPRLVDRVQRRLSTEKDTTAVSFERSEPHSVHSRRDSTGPNQEAQSEFQPKPSPRDDALPRLSIPRPSTKGSASRALEYPSSQPQPSSRQVGPVNRSIAEHQSRSPHKTTSAVKEPVLKLGGPSSHPNYVSPRLLPHSSPLPKIPAASTTSAIPEPLQTETQNSRGQWPGAEPAEAQPANRNHEVNSLSARTTDDSDQDEDQTPTTNFTYVAAPRTRGKYWPRGRI